MKVKLIFIFLIIIGFFTPIAKAVETDTTTVSTLSVTGSGESKAQPDIATLFISSTAKGKTASEATNLNASLTQKLIDTLLKMGVLEKDIQTSGLSIYPIYKQNQGGINDFGDVSKIIGYQASNSVNVIVRRIGDVGHIIDSVTLVGDYTVSGINFGLDKDDTFENDALKEAVTDARRKADVVAIAAGKSITGIKTISVGNAGSGNIFKGLGIAEASASTPVSPGELTVTADVSIEYLLNK